MLRIYSNHCIGMYLKSRITTSCVNPLFGPIAENGNVQKFILQFVVAPGAGITIGWETKLPSCFTRGGLFKLNDHVAIGVAFS
jgi:hypothetical protein